MAAGGMKACDDFSDIQDVTEHYRAGTGVCVLMADACHASRVHRAGLGVGWVGLGCVGWLWQQLAHFVIDSVCVCVRVLVCGCVGVWVWV